MNDGLMAFPKRQRLDSGHQPEVWIAMQTDLNVATNTAITWDANALVNTGLGDARADIVDPYGLHQVFTGIQAQVITLPYAGLWEFSGGISFTNTAAIIHTFGIQKYDQTQQAASSTLASTGLSLGRWTHVVNSASVLQHGVIPVTRSWFSEGEAFDIRCTFASGTFTVKGGGAAYTGSNGIVAGEYGRIQVKLISRYP